MPKVNPIFTNCSNISVPIFAVKKAILCNDSILNANCALVNKSLYDSFNFLLKHTAHMRCY